MDDATQKLVDEARETMRRQEWMPVSLVIRLADALEAAQRPPVSPEVEALEQELFKHQPVLSMRDGSIAGCQCMDRVFYTRTEDWGTHLAEVFESLARFSVPSQPVYDEEAIARWLAERVWMPGPNIAAALVAALRGGELTREET